MSLHEKIVAPGCDALAGYWDRYAAGVAEQTQEEALENAFGWTQYDDHGPGDELLGEPDSALELGCGRGNAVAALALKGVTATGVDVSPVQIQRATECWRSPNARYRHGDVLTFLAVDRRWDAIYSIWGAAWFTDPEALLPLVRVRLASGGRYVFSCAPPVPGSYGVQGMYGEGFKGRRVWVYRWAYEPETWADILHRHGFADAKVWIEPAPEPDLLGTLIATARG